MLKRALALGLFGLWLASPALATPKIVSLGSDSTGDGDPIAACGALAASPYEAGRPGSGLEDKQIFLDGALTACEAALRSSSDSPQVNTWLARVYTLVGRASDAVPLLERGAEAGNSFAAYLLSGLMGNATTDGVDDDAERSLDLLKQSADAGFVPAMVDLAARYETGNGVDTDWSEAVRLYQAASDEGDAHATFKLGSLYQGGNGVDQDYAKAMDLFQRAADAGEPLGYDGIGQLHQFGLGVELDYAKAASAYQQGADQGEPQSETALAYLYEQALGLPQDYDKSFALLTDAANQGYGFGQAALALHYLFGEGVAIDQTKAFELASAAERQHVNYAEGIVGYLYAEGLGTGRDLSEALTYFQSGADGGDQYSADRLAVTKLEIACQDEAGSQYEPNGIGHGIDFTSINAEKAISVCKTALEANPNSLGDQTWLGRAYARAKRYADALPLLKIGVDAGNVLAETLYADLLLAGTGVQKDADAAVALYRRAADEGFALAQFTLGRIYAEGKLVPADIPAALGWYKKAFEGGIDEAEASMAELTAPASPGQPDMGQLEIGFGREGPAY